MKRSSAFGWVVFCLLVTAAGVSTAGTGASAGLPVDVIYRGEIRDAAKAPLEGNFDLTIRYFAIANDKPILSEKHSQVPIRHGRFSVNLGCGDTIASGGGLSTLAEAFRFNPELELEVELGGEKYSPRVRLLPAGHSLRSRASLLGPAPGGDPAGRHSKGWGSESGESFVQAAVLSPGESPQAIRKGADEFQTNPFLIDIDGPAESIPLRDMAPAPPPQRSVFETAATDPEINPIRHETLYDANGNIIGTTANPTEDPLVPLSRSPISPQAVPALGVNFGGMGNISGYYPPDTEGAVGPNHYVQTTNVSYEIFNKNGTVAKAAALTKTIWSSLGGKCSTNNDGDAIVLYDKAAGRWLISQFSVSAADQAVCIAISKTNDPTGAYWLYRVPTLRYPDYFKIGAWPDSAHSAYFMGTNTGSKGAYDVYALDRDNMLAGNVARPAQAFQSYYNFQMPADFDGSTLPPAGSNGYFYTIKDGGEPYFNSPATDRIEVMEFNVDWATPANSTYGITTTITPTQGLVAFTWTVCGFFVNNCLPQPGTTVKIDSASWWPMKRLQYRNFGSRESFVANWTVSNSGQAAPRWFELRKTNGAPGGTWTLYQQGTHAPDASLHRWAGSIAMDQNGNVGFGYSTVNGSSPNYPTIKYSGRLAGDALGTLQAEATIQAGSGSQTGSAGRWGDYSSMTVDPADDCTFWFTSEYIATTGGAPWLTRIASFKFPTCSGCTAPGAPNLTSATGTCAGVNLAWTAGSGTTNSYNVYRSTNTSCPVGALTKLNGSAIPSGTLTYSDSTAVAGTTYTYVVRGACDSGGTTESGNSNCLAATRLAAPAAPTAVSATVNSCANIVVTWTNGVGATSHNVLRYNGACPSAVGLTTFTGVTTPYTDLTAAAGSSYCYVVRAVNACANTDAAGVTGTRLAIPATPAAPTATPTCSGIDLTWTAVPLAATYNVLRGTSCAGIASIATFVAGTAYSDASAVAGTSYFYAIQAVDSCGTSAAGACSGSVTKLVAPSAPTAVSATVNSCTNVVVTWTNGVGAASHNVLRYNGACPSAVGLTTFTGVTTPYTDLTAAAGSSYCYVVRAVNTCGNTDAAGVTGTRLTTPAAPTAVTATPGCTGNSIAWTNSPGATSHNVVRGTVCGTAVTTFSGVTTPYNDVSAVAGTTYNYWVVGVNSCGNSLNSSCVTAAILTVPSVMGYNDQTHRKSGADIAMTWGAVSGATGYDVWYTSNPVANPWPDPNPGNTVPAGWTKANGSTIAGLAWTHIGAAGNATQYYYHVAPSNSCGSNNSEPR